MVEINNFRIELSSAETSDKAELAKKSVCKGVCKVVQLQVAASVQKLN